MRVILVLWLLVASFLLFYPAAKLVQSSPEPAKSAIPTAPAAPTLAPVPDSLDEEKGKAYSAYIDAQVNRYTQEVSAYKEYVAAVKEGNESAERSDLFGVYQLIGKETLASLLSGFVTAIVGYFLIKAGGEAAAKYKSATKG